MNPKNTPLPTLFIGHGSPMNTITDNPYRQWWQALGASFREADPAPQAGSSESHTINNARFPTPSAILCISAHWLTCGGYALTSSPAPRTIHDFGGFPPELFAQQYKAPGAPDLAAQLAQALTQSGFHTVPDDGAWGLDHGSWGVLKPMFPAANIPVLQLSMDFDAPLEQHYTLGRRLGELQQTLFPGLLIVGSGNVVHNLREMRPERQHGEASDAAPWAVEFERLVFEALNTLSGSTTPPSHVNNALAQLPHTHPALYHRAHAGHPDHFLPLLFCVAAAAARGQKPQWQNLVFQGGTVSMASVVWN